MSSPSLVYMGHALYQLSILEKERHRKKSQLRGELERGKFETSVEQRNLEQEICKINKDKLNKLNKASFRGTLLCTYVTHILLWLNLGL